MSDQAAILVGGSVLLLSIVLALDVLVRVAEWYQWREISVRLLMVDKHVEKAHSILAKRQAERTRVDEELEGKGSGGCRGAN